MTISKHWQSLVSLPDLAMGVSLDDIEILLTVEDELPTARRERERGK